MGPSSCQRGNLTSALTSRGCRLPLSLVWFGLEVFRPLTHKNRLKSHHQSEPPNNLLMREMQGIRNGTPRTSHPSAWIHSITFPTYRSKSGGFWTTCDVCLPLFSAKEHSELVAPPLTLSTREVACPFRSLTSRNANGELIKITLGGYLT